MGKKSNRTAFNFNKQILSAELGAFIFALVFAFASNLFFQNPSIISLFVIAGSVIGAAVFWIGTRVIDNSKHEDYSVKELLRDMSYFTPVAFVLTWILYYPSLYFLTNIFLRNDHRIFFSVVFAQAIACCLFLAGINIYRYSLIRFFGKHL